MGLSPSDLAKQFSAKVLGGQDVQADKQKAQREQVKAKTRTLGHFIDDHYGPWVRVERKTGAATLHRVQTQFASFMNLSLEAVSPCLVEKWQTQRGGRQAKPQARLTEMLSP